MSSAQITLLHLSITFSVATFILWRWKLLRFVLPLAITSLWPAAFLAVVISNPNLYVSDSINLFAWILNPIVQAWIYKYIYSKFQKNNFN